MHATTQHASHAPDSRHLVVDVSRFESRLHELNGRDQASALIALREAIAVTRTTNDVERRNKEIRKILTRNTVRVQRVVFQCVLLELARRKSHPPSVVAAAAEP